MFMDNCKNNKTKRGLSDLEWDKKIKIYNESVFKCKN